MAAASLAGIILAAGKGTRMKSELPKCLHRVAGLPMAEFAIRALRAAGASRIVVVIGHGGDQLRAVLGESVEYAWQTEQLGTGHAALAAKSALGDHDGPILVVPGDAPLLRGEALNGLVGQLESSGSAMVLATVEMTDPTGYGRVICDELGRPLRIVEEKDADANTKKIREVCVSVYAFRSKELFETLPTLANQNAQGEYYLTDTVAAMASSGLGVEARAMPTASDFEGVNDRWQLALAEKTMRLRILADHAARGVTIGNLDSVFIGPDVEIGVDTVLEQGVSLGGVCRIGSNCRIGPSTSIEDARIGDGSTIIQSYLRRCIIGNNVSIGPFANIRPYANIGDRCRIGNFVEIKNSTLDSGVSASHLSYIGDAGIGSSTNIGAGVITANYDGYQKHNTTIGSEAFVGSNSTLIAPVTIGSGAFVVAGSVVTVDVPANAGAFGRARTEIKEDWAERWRLRRAAESKAKGDRPS